MKVQVGGRKPTPILFKVGQELVVSRDAKVRFVGERVVVHEIHAGFVPTGYTCAIKNKKGEVVMTFLYEDELETLFYRDMQDLALFKEIQKEIGEKE